MSARDAARLSPVDVEDLRRAIGAERFDAACRERWAADDLLGSRDGPGADVPHELSDPMWFEGALTAAERIDLLFAVYERMPGYALLMYATGPLRGVHDAGEGALLGGLPRAARAARARGWPSPWSTRCGSTTTRTPSTAEEAWRETSGQAGDWERRLERILPAAGPGALRRSRRRSTSA